MVVYFEYDISVDKISLSKQITCMYLQCRAVVPYTHLCITYWKTGRRGGVIFQIGVQLSSCLSPGVRLTMTGNWDVNNEANTVRTTAECSREEHTRVPRIYNP